MDLSEHWKTIVDTLRDGLLVVSPEGVIMGVNPSAGNRNSASACLPHERGGEPVTAWGDPAENTPSPRSWG